MTKFAIGDRVKAKEDATVYLTRDKVYTITQVETGDQPQVAVLSDNGRPAWLHSHRFELYAKAGEFVSGDIVMPANTAGGPWQVLDVQARDDGQRICFSGEYGQWWRADAYRLATAEEVATGEAISPGWAVASRSIPASMEPQPIPAADFDFSTIKRGDEVLVRMKVHSYNGTYITPMTDGGGEGAIEFRPSEIVSVIPAPKPLRERVSDAINAEVPYLMTNEGAVSASDWRPISTAPCDLSPVLVFIPGHGEDFDIIAVAFWKRTGWVMQEDDHMGCDPTHWMPLPPPPKS